MIDACICYESWFYQFRFLQTKPLVLQGKNKLKIACMVMIAPPLIACPTRSMDVHPAEYLQASMYLNISSNHALP